MTDPKNNTNILITIAGPTAVGKTSIALELARHFHCEIFSADSRQIYRELNIGTAKPSQEELNSVSHHFINHRSITEKYNADIFEKELIETLIAYFKNNQIAILTGGTGFYIKAALYGLDSIPDIPNTLTDNLETKLKEKGLLHLQKDLLDLDPEIKNKIDLSNPRRVIRALSVIKHTGKSISEYRSGETQVRNFMPIKILLARDREELYNKINFRVDQMLKDGLVDEVSQLLEYQDLPSLQTVGYQELIGYFNGLISYEEAIRLIKRNSRRYAKRQITWFNNQDVWETFHPDDIESIIAYVSEKINYVLNKND